jgi:hypothetical protein
MKNKLNSLLILNMLERNDIVELPQYETPSYTNAGGTGVRVDLVLITISAALTGTGNLTNSFTYLMINGATDDTIYCEPAGAVDNTFTLKFTFLNKVIINEAKAYWGLTPLATHGIWKWQIDPEDDGNWRDVGANFTLGGSAIQTLTTLSANTTPAKAYRIIGVSGNVNTGGYAYWAEYEFKIGNHLG